MAVMLKMISNLQFTCVYILLALYIGLLLIIIVILIVFVRIPAIRVPFNE